MSAISVEESLRLSIPPEHIVLDHLELSSDILQQYFENNFHFNGSAAFLSASCLDQTLSHVDAFQSCLTTYLLALTIAEDAIGNFIGRRCKSFDALIGNNSCYVVAYHIFSLFIKMDTDEVFQKEVHNAYKDISQKRNEVAGLLNSFNLKFPLNLKFRDFLRINRLDVKISLDIIYFSMCFGCAASKMKNSCEYEEISYDKLLEKYKSTTGLSLAKKSTIKLIKHWQRIVSHINVRKLQFHARLISKDLKDWVDYLAEEHISEDSHARLCMPSLYSLRAIYCSLLTIPGALIGLQVNVISGQNTYVGRFTIYFEVQQNKLLKNIKQESIQITKPVYVFSGCRYINNYENCCLQKLESSFSNRNLSDIIFAHEVTYPQYPKSLKKENIVPNSPLILNEINRLKKLKGFSLKDPTDFCTVHVYVDDTDTQALSAYEPPVYLPNLSY